MPILQKKCIRFRMHSFFVVCPLVYATNLVTLSESSGLWRYARGMCLVMVTASLWMALPMQAEQRKTGIVMQRKIKG